MYYCRVGIYIYRLISYRVKITLNNNNKSLRRNEIYAEIDLDKICIAMR